MPARKPAELLVRPHSERLCAAVLVMLLGSRAHTADDDRGQRPTVADSGSPNGTFGGERPDAWPDDGTRPDPDQPSTPSDSSSGPDAGAPQDLVAAILPCVEHFEQPAGGRWHFLSGEHYYVDLVGRPAAVSANVPPIDRDDERDENCQRDVGHWGDDADASQDYDGGHLLGYQFGGWGGRANLVPLRAQLDTGARAACLPGRFGRPKRALKRGPEEVVVLDVSVDDC